MRTQPLGFSSLKKPCCCGNSSAGTPVVGRTPAGEERVGGRTPAGEEPSCGGFRAGALGSGIPAAARGSDSGWAAAGGCSNNGHRGRNSSSTFWRCASRPIPPSAAQMGSVLWAAAAATVRTVAAMVRTVAATVRMVAAVVRTVGAAVLQRVVVAEENRRRVVLAVLAMKGALEVGQRISCREKSYELSMKWLTMREYALPGISIKRSSSISLLLYSESQPWQQNNTALRTLCGGDISMTSNTEGPQKSTRIEQHLPLYTQYGVTSINPTKSSVPWSIERLSRTGFQTNLYAYKVAELSNGSQKSHNKLSCQGNSSSQS
ncbi:tRNA sulfurtransferase [Striga asiatica]|uniref:tRNA sulfurtransferase n=1 Tax=Striga asiatica TaxID=4170 RepID=A0A5A7R3B0_STRAF|nr:tRNA sulfurtransferase [Striga asiatica]